jgi:hypothetical protein
LKDLYNENYKTLKNRLKKTLEDRKASQIHRLAGLIVLMAMLLKRIYRLNVFTVKFPRAFFTELEKKSILKFIWKPKVPK